MSLLFRLLRWALLLGLALLLVTGVAGGILYARISSSLPPVDSLRAVNWQEPLYIYTRDGKLFGVFGETRRYPVDIAQVPMQVRQAFVAAEDASFYTHSGVDPKGVSRAVWQVLTKKEGRVAGGSTITQQVARQFFLTNEVSYSRKAAEMLLAMRIEKLLTKDQILELYLNKSFFGNRAHGVVAAAQFYYGKPLDQLSLAEVATLVSSLKFPSSGNPLSNPVRNHQRSVYVIERMREDGYVTPSQATQAEAEQVHPAPHEVPLQAYAPYAAEMVRQEMLARYGQAALESGYHVVTSLDSTLQEAADQAMRDGLETYDHRHGWRGPEKQLQAGPGDDDAALAKLIADAVPQGGLSPAVVAGTSPDGTAAVVLRDGRRIVLPVASSKWTGRTPAKLLARGDLVRIRADLAKDKDGNAKPDAPPVYTLEQLPLAQSALVSLDADTGAIRAIVGGFSFAANKFNRVTQARRQPGSSFKPFLYASAFDKGFNPLSIVLDAPVVFRDRRGHVWQPGNDDGKVSGPMRLREALVRSKNLVSVRLLDAIGVDYARKFIQTFGFSQDELPPNLSMALGSASLTPLSVARGYTVFANGGFLVTPWLVERVEDREGKEIFKQVPAVACKGCAPSSGAAAQPQAQVVDGFNFGPAAQAAQAKASAETPTPAASVTPPATPLGQTTAAPRALDPRIAYQVVSMMRDVVLRGTGYAAKTLGREDVAGKTGSTNDYRDAWFSGLGGPLVTTVWVGRDDYRSLGHGELGGRAALPIWIDYMRVALKDQPIRPNDPPEGMVQVSRNGATEWVKAEDAERIEQDNELNAQDAGNEAAFDIF